MTVKERETAEFSIELSHEKIPVVWYKNDVRLHPSKVVHMSEEGKAHTLAFKEVTLDDTSIIRVEAMDMTSEAMLTVLGQYHVQMRCDVSEAAVSLHVHLQSKRSHKCTVMPGW